MLNISKLSLAYPDCVVVRDFSVQAANGLVLVRGGGGRGKTSLMCVLAGNFKAHRWGMWTVYISACLIAGAFTLLPGRYLGRLIWGTWFGWL